MFLATTRDLVETAGVTFSGACDSYRVTHDSELQRQRLEEAYFLYKLLIDYGNRKIPLKIDQRDESCRLDVEKLCKIAFEMILNDVSDYSTHACNVLGCKEGFIMADGIEKVW